MMASRTGGRTWPRIPGIAALAGAILFALSATAPAEVLEVGPGKLFQRIEDAVRRARPGDVVLVHPLPDGGAYAKVALIVGTPRLTIRAAPSGDGRRVRLDGAGFDYSGILPVPRAIVQFDPGADGCVLEGFDLTNARNRNANGAGVRINQANDVVVRNCEIHHNDMGMMSGGYASKDTGRNQRIESAPPGEPNPPAQMLQYKAPLRTEPRPAAGRPDAGAYEAK